MENYVIYQYRVYVLEVRSMGIAFAFLNIGIWFGLLVGIVMLIGKFLSNIRETRRQAEETNKKLDIIINQMVKDNSKR